MDTAVFHYNSEGKVDSMYLKNDDYFNIKLTYTGGKLTKWTRYTGTDAFFYWNIETGAKGNIAKAEEWEQGASGFEKTATYTYTRDDRKNPFETMAPYMFYLDDDYAIFRFWGSNDYTDQRYVDPNGSGIGLTTGYKFKYDSNCYPVTAQMTLPGTVIFADDDYRFTYY